MFMVCWHYCVPFLNFLLYAIAPIMVGLGCYVMKRGLVQYRRDLRKRALGLWVLALVKFVFVDVEHILYYMFCDVQTGQCSEMFSDIKDASTVVFTVVGAGILYKLHQVFIPDKPKQRPVKTDLKPLRQWTFLSIVTVSLFVLWVLSPWITSLTIGSIPTLFLTLSWHHLGILASVSLLMSFWRLEDFQWYYSSTKSKAEHKKHVWVPKDTLWTLVLIHTTTLLLAFASSGMIDSAINQL